MKYRFEIDGTQSIDGKSRIVSISASNDEEAEIIISLDFDVEHVRQLDFDEIPIPKGCLEI